MPRNAIHALISDATQSQFGTLLSTLQAQQLVQVVEGDRRQLHPIVATYVQNYDEQNNKTDMLLDHEKAAQYYVQAAKKYPPLNERQHVSDVRPLIEAVWQFCQAEQWQEAYNVMVEEYLFADLRLWGGTIFLLELCQTLLVGSSQYERSQNALIYSNIASTYGTLGQKQEALKYYGQALAIFGEVGDRGGEGITLNNLGLVYDDLGQKQEALKYYEQALAIFGEVGDRGGEGTTLHNIGVIYYEEKRFDVALSCFILAKYILVEVQSPDSEDEQEWIDDLHQAIGDKQFADLLQNVEPHAQQIVDDALREV